jgi:hypothetical protein
MGKGLYTVVFFNKQGWGTTTINIVEYSRDGAIYAASRKSGLNLVARAELICEL